jgi:UDP-glucose 4-epimerase
MKKTNSKIIITGAAGFIGSHIAQRLLDEGYHILALDNLVSGYRKNLPPGADFLNIDISDAKSLAKLPAKNIKAVIHLAAQSSGEVSSEKPLVDLMTNAAGTLLLLIWCRNNGIKRFIFSSSMAVYGQPASLPVKENDRCCPLSFYGISKLTAENYINNFRKKGMYTTIFRLFSVYGPGQDLSNMKQGMVSIYLSYLLKNRVLQVKGSGERFRDFIYIDDVSETIAKSIDSPVTFGKTYNLATGIKTLVKDLIKLELEVLGKDIKKYPVKYEGSTPDDQFGLYADITRIKKDLHWKTKITLSEGIRRMVKWARG